MAHDQGVVSIKLGNISVPYVSSTGQRAKFTFSLPERLHKSDSEQRAHALG
jgi:hypothetical protein